MLLSQIELRRIRLPLVTPFRSSQGFITERELLLVRLIGPEVEGWGECVALSSPEYTGETVDSAHNALKRELIPLLPADSVSPWQVSALLGEVVGNSMAKAALEMGLWDAELRSREVSLAQHLGATRSRVPAGVAVGVMDAIDDLLAAVESYVDQGYSRVKLKIQPGWDVEPVRAVRDRFDGLPLQVDANMAYKKSDFALLAELDEFGLLMLEQPLAANDLAGHAELARQIQTPICLDESLSSAEAAEEAVELGACSIVNIKPGRLGGLAEALRLHDFCLERSIPAWCGGMLESGIGRAANLALAALPGFTLAGDLSASNRYFYRDLTPPFELRDGHIDVPTGPGIGVEPLPEMLDEATVSTELIEL